MFITRQLVWVSKVFLLMQVVNSKNRLFIYGPLYKHHQHSAIRRSESKKIIQTHSIYLLHLKASLHNIIMLLSHMWVIIKVL